MAFILSNIYVQALILCTIPVLLLYVKCMFTFQYWKNKRVPYLKPTFPFGNFRTIFLFQKSFSELFDDFYRECKYRMKLRFCGVYNMANPILFISDPYLLKYVLIKDFDTFINRGMLDIDEKAEPILRNLFSKEGNEWRKLRNKLSPTFTPGKVKSMYPLIKRCSQHLVKKLNSDILKFGKNVDIKDYCARYTTDVIGSAAFGVEINSIENPQSEFRKYSDMVLKPSYKNMMKISLVFMAPIMIRSIATIKYVDEKIAQFFSDMVSNNLKYRDENNIKRDDFLDIMMEMKNQQKDAEISTDDVEITVDVITAQAFIFFLAGYETSFSALTFCLFELAKNEEIQSKLRNEISKTLEEFDGNLTYEALLKMSYLDKVCKETLRMYPILPQLNRETIHKYQIPDTNIVLDAGTKVVIPIMSIHRDPEYYSNPNVFNPENISKENIEARTPLTYLPFGDGPRNCIGLRFALIQFKCGLAELISNFEFSVDKREEIKFMRGSFVLQTNEPLKLTLIPVA